MIVYKHVSAVPLLKSFVATEMIARTAKHDLMNRWRNVKSTDDLDYKKEALLYFNLLLGKDSKEYWNGVLRNELLGIFGGKIWC